jgi:glycosyltransferase involved in cell wall biosynthesis
MRVAAYIALHYGSDYLDYAIRSVYESVDEIFVLYSASASHGHETLLPCTDSKEKLMDICNKYPKVRWFDGNWKYENEQRNFGYKFARDTGFDILVILDADEVWETQYLKELIKETYERKAQKCLVWMRHLWRSFNWICDDAMRQERIYYLGSDYKDLIYADKPNNQIWHFGYARDLNSIEYKISCHGHSGEWLIAKQKWFKEKYCAFPPVNDVHPTCENTWNPKAFDKNELPKIMHEHPYFKLDKIY